MTFEREIAEEAAIIFMNKNIKTGKDVEVAVQRLEKFIAQSLYRRLHKVVS